MLNPLRYFLEVARTGSIRAASETMNVAPSAISRHIQLFEHTAGLALFERHPRGMTPTAAGDVYVRYARSVLHEEERARADIDALKGLRRGHIRIATIDGIMAGALARVIAVFRRDHPGITIHLRGMGTETVMQAVRDGEADIGLAFHSSPLAGVDIVKRIRDPLIALVPLGHEFEKNREVSFQEVMAQPLALPETTFGIRKLVDAACHVHHIRPNIALETNSIEALRAFAREGSGITLLPSLSAQRELELKTVSGIHVRERTLKSSSMDLCIREGRKLPLATVAFLDLLGRHFGTDR